MVEVDPYRDEDFYHLEEIKCISIFRRLVRQLDLYALPITLRYKSEKMFYTNFGACTSILLVLTMVGILANEITTMFEKNNIVQTVTSIPSNRREDGLEQGGVFLFGYRFVSDTGQAVSIDSSVAEAEIVTKTYQWNTGTNTYESDETKYFMNNCQQVFNDDILNDPLSDRL